MKRSVAVATVIGVAATSGGSAWIAASQITSPDDAKRAARAPKASLVTVPVEKRALSANLVLRGSLSFDEATTIQVPSGGQDAGTRVITKDPPALGTDVVEGQSIAEISGRPLFVLQGTLPVFRDLRPGSTGDDVTQLEESLARLGHDPGPVDGTYDAATEAAVDALYSAAGYTQREPTAAERDRIEGARTALTSAQSELTAARAALQGATSSASSELVRLETELEAARRAVTTTRQAQSAARAAVDPGTALARQELATATSVRDVANAFVAAASAPGAINPDTGEAYTAAEIAGLRAAVNDAQEVVDEKARAVGETAKELTDAATAADEAASAADGAVRVASAALAEARRGRGEAERSAVTAAEQGVASAMKELTEAESVSAGLLQSEAVFLRSLPRRVGSVSLHRGDVATGELVQVSGSNLAVRTSVTAADRSLVKPGTKVTIAESDLDLRFDGVVAKVADQPDGGTSNDSAEGSGSGDGQNGSGSGGDRSSGRFAVEIAPGELPSEVDLPTLEGLNFRVTIPVKSTEGKVLAVPAAALSATGDDRVRVEVAISGSRTEFVDVRKGLAAQGFVEVSSLKAGRLKEGDEVVVGR